jgi:uncharacterized protein (DUF1697 family)
MADILNANPDPSHDPKHTYVLFLDASPTQNALDTVTGQDGEEMRLGKREIYIAYPNGMGSSKLKIPAGKTGTARNLNTVGTWLKSRRASKVYAPALSHSTQRRSPGED